MRCSCKKCGTYMVQADDLTLGCRCPDCGERCTACLGTNTVMSADEIRGLAFDFRVMADPFARPVYDEYEEECFSGTDGFEDYSD